MKKGYMFTLDAAIAIFILIIGLSIVFFQYSKETQTLYITEHISEDIIGVLGQTNVSDLCSFNGGCSCLYQSLQYSICTQNDPLLVGYEGSVLSMFAVMIKSGTHTGDEVEDIIHDIFVHGNVIDEKRFGFAVLYTDVSLTTTPLEIYNTETYPR
jgi:hypothetical protein